MLIDTHCHLQYEKYSNLDDVICDILKTDVKVIVVSGYDVKSSNDAIALAHKYNNIYATVGFHPDECENIKESDFENFDRWLKDDRVVGVGEIGLDYYHDVSTKEKQIELFKKQIKIAQKYNKPIIVHNRDASEDVYKILSKEKVKGILHCFNDTYEMASRFVELGYMLGIGGIVTFKKNNLKSVVEKISLDNIVLETDSPYLTPEPYRGRINTPANIPIIATSISKIKNIAYDEVVTKTTSNACAIFDFEDQI
ncbi:MAG TPA: TatD family hydrolase [Mollicutes bacterium]|nr:TatD family hydrolase [Mollicutes bacterium]